jgi:murein DD-endopeptidase MepM/ murein hydrolase activator NlpD
MRWEIFTHGGRNATGIDAIAYSREAASLGAGELLVTSIDRDGTREGYDTELLARIGEAVSVPVIASGGAGNAQHVAEALEVAQAALLASILHEDPERLGSLRAELRAAQARLKVLEEKTRQVLADQRAEYERLARNKAALDRAFHRTKVAQRNLAAKIDKIIREQAARGRIPSQYNGTLRWPMPGIVTQEFGCTGFAWEPPYGDCAHFHQGIDIVAPYGTPVHASGAGRVAYIGWNWADGADPAWIVIIAHSGNLETWYAHMQPRYPVSQGEWVTAGEVVGYEGNTGHSTGAHLHWAVRQNGVFVNPRLFL